jgi:hypothetical protein
MRLARHTLLAVFALGLLTAALNALYAPLWGLLWLPWLVGCLLLRRGLVVGLLLMLATSVGTVVFCAGTTTYEPDFFWLPRLTMGVVAAAGGVTALIVARRLWRRDLLATTIVTLAAVALGAGAAALHLALPKVPACPRGPFELGWTWHWLNGSLHEQTRGGVRTSWGRHCLGGGGWFCDETAVDARGAPAGRTLRWAIHQLPLDPERYEREAVYERGYRTAGVLESSGYLARRGRVGRWDRFHANGQLAESGRYHDDRRVGPWRRLYDNGRPLETGSYRDGQPAGIWRCYLPSGVILRQGRYCPDDACGHYGCKPGRQCNAWRCSAGNPCGTWTYWDEEGRATVRPASRVEPRCEEELPAAVRRQHLLY